ncbi:MAG: FAD-binding oxidoreductase, partial [Rhodospirillaceae bacterium]|nr:FAD-binding oxidoreductase [Rhodospirillaceae bacterium]
RHTRVTDINLLPSGAWEVITDKGNLIAEHVVNAAGCYARPIAQMAGTDVPIINMLHQYFVTDEIPKFADDDEEMPVVRNSHSSCYYRQEQKSAPHRAIRNRRRKRGRSLGISGWHSGMGIRKRAFRG